MEMVCGTNAWSTLFQTFFVLEAKLYLMSLARFTFSKQDLSRNIFLGSTTAAMWMPHVDVSTCQM